MRPVIRGVQDVRPVTDVPTGISCWQGSAKGVSITFVLEAPATAEAFDEDFIEAALANLPTHLASAAQAIRTQFAITPREPELTFWPGSEWMILYADCTDRELGIAVTFDGAKIIEIDDLDESEEDES